MARKKLGEMLVEAGVLTEQGLRIALNEQRRWGGTLGRTLVELRQVSEPELVRVLAAQLAVPTIDLDHLEIHSTVLDLVPADLAEQHNLVPFAQPMKFLDVAMADPTNLGVIDELRIRTQLNIRSYLAGPKMIERALATHYHRGFAGRRPARADIDLSMDLAGDTVNLEPMGGPQHGRPDTAEIDAARRREGLRPSARPSRPPPLDTRSPARPQSSTASGGYGPPPIGGLGDLGLGGGVARAPAPAGHRDAEIDALQDRISQLEALVERDEGVLRKVLALLVEKGVATRDEILERIR